MGRQASGSIVKEYGKFRARLTVDGERRNIGTFPTKEEAEVVLTAFISSLESRTTGPYTAKTLQSFGDLVMDEREIERLAGIRQERSRWRFLRQHTLALRPIKDITPLDIADIRRELSRKPHPRKKGPIDSETVNRYISLLSIIFSSSVARGLRRDNPALHQMDRLAAKRAAKHKTEEVWDYLRPEEQQAFLACKKIPEWGRTIVEFALWTGLRQGEQWNAELRDLHLDVERPHLFVRYGSQGRSPKSGKARRVYLSQSAVAAAKRWVDQILPKYCPKNDLGLIFPSPSGGRRPVGAPNIAKRLTKTKVRKKYLFAEWLKLAGIQRHLRWHDLRHTCASSLVAGWWGRRWSLEEVKEHLGHSSILITQRYAHLAGDVLSDAIRDTPGLKYRSDIGRNTPPATQVQQEITE